MIFTLGGWGGGCIGWCPKQELPPCGCMSLPSSQIAVYIHVCPDLITGVRASPAGAQYQQKTERTVDDAGNKEDEDALNAQTGRRDHLSSPQRSEVGVRDESPLYRPITCGHSHLKFHFQQGLDRRTYNPKNGTGAQWSAGSRAAALSHMVSFETIVRQRWRGTPLRALEARNEAVRGCVHF